MGMIWEFYVWCEVKVYGTSEELQDAMAVVEKIGSFYKPEQCDGYLKFESSWDWVRGDVDNDEDYDGSEEDSAGIIYTLHEKVASSLPHLKSEISTYNYMEDIELTIKSYTSEVGARTAERDLIHYYNPNTDLMVPEEWYKEELGIICPACNKKQKIPFEVELWENRYQDDVKHMEIPVICESCKTQYIVKQSMHERECY